MFRTMITCLLLLTSAVHAEDGVQLAFNEARAMAKTAAARPRERILTVNKCWRREPAVDAIMDSAKLPVEFCVRTIAVKVDGDGGTMSVAGELTPAGTAAAVAIDAGPQPMTSYASTASRVYAAYLFVDHNAHGDTGSITVSFRLNNADGRIAMDSLWADFAVGCPQEECLEGSEPGVRSFVRDWP